MKKKILSLLFAIVMLIPLSLCVGASPTETMPSPYDNANVILSPDFQSLYYNDVLYERFNSYLTEWDYSHEHSDSNCNIDEVDYVDYTFSSNDAIISASIYLLDGSDISVSYINTKYLAEHTKLTQNPIEYTVDFIVPSDNNVIVGAAEMLGEKGELPGKLFGDYSRYNVYAYNNDGSFYLVKGQLFYINETYYYVDFIENSIKKPYEFDPNNYSNLISHKITDTDTITALNSAYDKYNSDPIGFLTGNFVDSIGIAALFLVFVLLPLVVFVVFLIRYIRAKAPAYKKIFRIIWIVSLAELACTVISIILIFAFK